MNEENNFSYSNETQEKVVGYSNNGEGNGGKQKDSAVKIFVGILVFAILIGIVGVIAYAVTSKSSSKNDFISIFADDYLFGINAEIGEQIEKSNKMTADVSLDVDEMIKTFGGEKIGLSTLTFRASALKDKNDSTEKASILIDNKDIVSMKLAKTGKLYGLSVPGLFDEYIAIKDENLKELAKKFDLDEELIEQIPNSISEYIDKNNGVYNEFKKPLQKYVDMLSDELTKKMIEEKDVEITIAGKSFKTTAHKVTLTEKDANEIGLKMLKKLKDDKALYELLEKYKLTESLYIDSYEDWKSEIDYSIEDIEDSLKEDYFDSEDVILSLIAYTLKRNTMAIKFAFEEEDVAIMLANTTEKNKSITELSMITGTETVGIVKLETEKSGKAYNSEIGVQFSNGSVSVEMELFKIAVTTDEAKGIDKLEKISDKNVFLINDATTEKMEEKLEEIEEASEEYLKGIYEKLPETLKTMFDNSSTDILDDITSNTFTDDSDFYKYNSYGNYDYYNKPGDFKIKGTQVEILGELQNLYNKIEIGMSEEELIKIFGKEDENDEYAGRKDMRWKNDSNTGYVQASIYNGVVTAKDIDATSNSYKSVSISKEIDTKLEDLPSKAAKLKEGMTLDEVINILGNGCFETRRTEDSIKFTWYDVDENYVPITFRNNKISYIGVLWGAY